MIVQEHGVVYDLGGDLTSVIGMRTMQSSGTPATCTGAPGDPAGGRKCSATVYATSVPQIASALGWTLTTTP